MVYRETDNHNPVLSAVLLRSRLEKDLRSRMLSGEWQPGSIFPSRRELARQYGVAVGTIEKAVATLLLDGTLQVVKGRGTVVAQIPAQTHEDAAAKQALTLAEIPNTAAPLLGVLVIQQGEFHPEALEDHPTWVPRVARAIEHEVAQVGGKTCFVNIDRSNIHSRAAIANAVEQLLQQGAQALVVTEIFGNENDTAMEEILALNDRLSVPMVLLTWTDILNVIPHVFYDNRYMGYQAAQHLLHVGYHDLVFLAPYTVGWAEERFAGARAVLRQSGLPEDILQWYPPQPGKLSLDIDPCDVECETAKAFLAGQLAQPGRFSNASLGVIAVNDAMALHFHAVAAAAGLVAGRDYGLIGFDDRVQTSELGISSMHPPLEEMGKEAVLLATRALRGEKIPIQIRLQADVIARGSTCRAFIPAARV
ncbi:MAG TPA: substrate-binding domain-containing protein [Armatimonadota bacterium]|nr:substrate-binding domain-containing protein [Armatimonadota bacterium]